MDSLAEIIKNLAISKILVVAVFITTAMMYFGPVVLPNHIPSLTQELIPYLFATMLFSATLLILWTLCALWIIVKQGIRSTAREMSGLTGLSEAEKSILLVMAQNPTNPLNLDLIDYSNAPASKLEFHQHTNTLQRKGFASINPYDDNLISLTERGRKKALEIQKADRTL